MKKRGLSIFIFLILFLTGCGSSTTVKNISMNEVEKKIEKKESFILEVMQTGCSACKSYEPIFQSVMKEYHLNAYVINLKELSEEETKKLDEISYISGTPTTLFFKEGKLKNSSHKIVGSISSDALKTRLKYLDWIE